MDNWQFWLTVGACIWLLMFSAACNLINGWLRGPRLWLDELHVWEAIPAILHLFLPTKWVLVIAGITWLLVNGGYWITWVLRLPYLLVALPFRLIGMGLQTLKRYLTNRRQQRA